MPNKPWHNTSKYDIETQKDRVKATNNRFEESAEVYWLYLSHMTDPKTEGYIGVSIKSENRLEQHKKDLKKFLTKEEYQNLQIKILFEGKLFQASLKEKEYRPKMGIGWNYSVGGGFSLGGGESSEKAWRKWL